MTAASERFRLDYPVLYDFLDTVLRPGGDGTNVINLLVRVAWFGHPDRTRRLIDELLRIAEDAGCPPQQLSELFNQEIHHVLVTPDNAKLFCVSMAETLDFVVERRAPQGRSQTNEPSI
jgi:hypothetical protein